MFNFLRVSDALRDALAQVKELSRHIPELQAIKVQLETERDALKIEVSDLQDALRDALARLDTANSSLTQLRADLERRLREKDEEIDGIRSVALRYYHRNKTKLEVGTYIKNTPTSPTRPSLTVMILTHKISRINEFLFSVKPAVT